MKIAAVCCTYLRPRQLGRILHCFQWQNHENRELLILDDAGQYGNQQGDRWRLVSTNRRYPTLGEKRNAAAALVSADVEALAVWDDDDIYLPHALAASVGGLRWADWSRPSLVLLPQPDGSLRQHETGGLFHAAWSYRAAAFRAVEGYPAYDNGEDQRLADRFVAAGATEADPLSLGYRPFYINTWGNLKPWSVGASPGHLSAMGPSGYRRLGKARAKRVGRPTALVSKRPPVDPDNPRIQPGIYPRPF